jgi:hypothetical protein
MDIFIGNLPGSKYEPEILGLLKNFDSHANAGIKTPIHKHRENGYFCIASIKHDKTARRFIKKFNQKSPYGHRLKIREYVHRCYGNERRSINWRDSKWQGHEKRARDRRVYIAQTEI